MFQLLTGSCLSNAAKPATGHFFIINTQLNAVIKLIDIIRLFNQFLLILSKRVHIVAIVLSSNFKVVFKLNLHFSQVQFGNFN